MWQNIANMEGYKIIRQSKAEKRQRFEELTQVFLLYNYLNLSQKEKDKFFDEQVPEVIFRTMRLEGENITRSEIKEILNRKK